MKDYVGTVKTRETQFGNEACISFSRVELDKMYAKLNAKGYINLKMNKRKEVGQYGQTHSIYIDDWQPPAQVANQAPPTPTAPPAFNPQPVQQGYQNSPEPVQAPF